MKSSIKKAVIPAAGLGTRFLPATKSIPKEMLTLVDAPIILYVVEEALDAGIEDIILIAGRGKHAIEDFFDISYELEDKLAKAGKTELIARLIRVREKANIISIRQKQPLGLGHAVLCAEPIVGREPFAVLLGDEIMMSAPGEVRTTRSLCQSAQELGSSVVAVMKVEDSEISKYGIAEVQEPGESDTLKNMRFVVENFIEKPTPSQTSSRWALPGRYVFTGHILNLLQEARPGINGEIQLTDAMAVLARQQKIWASTFQSQRYDAGDKLGYILANLQLGLSHPELATPLRKELHKIFDRGTFE
ncbi:MAG: UTP--glucose-1-phosphate uridylyltransferase [Bdellovibrio sp.]